MKNTHHIIFLLIVIVSCQENTEDVNVESKTPLIESSIEDESVVYNDLLIKSAREFVTGDGPHIDEKYGSTQDFEKQNFKFEYLSDTIYAQAVQYVNACGDAIAWVELNGDSLILTTKEQSENLCLSADWYKYEYWIENTGNRKYIIIQK